MKHYVTKSSSSIVYLSRKVPLNTIILPPMSSTSSSLMENNDNQIIERVLVGQFVCSVENIIVFYIMHVVYINFENFDR